jgi:pimeloyl-ACP methyl ester carboxylesterase
MPDLTPLPLPPGIRSRIVEGTNGLSMHVLEAGERKPGRRSVLLLHGFPELAFSWRKVMPQLAAAGHHVIAPDQRGYGRTTGCDTGFDCELRTFSLLNLARDALALVSAFGLREVDVVGHDFGSSVAAWCALTRPDVFRSVVMMSAPFAGVPPLPFDTIDRPATPREDPVHRDLAALPRPRKHYQWYYSTREADRDMHDAPQGLHDFLRAYYHAKSADWPDNQPSPLAGWTAPELAKLPTYYVMDHHETMAETVAKEMPTPQQIAGCAWLPDDQLAIYSAEYRRTGFQGGLNWYRCGTTPEIAAELQLFSGRTIDVPSAFIAGRQDWGIYQKPGAIEAMQSTACTDLRGVHLIDGAGHWVQQEQPDEVASLLLKFLTQGRA